ncbi:MAG TPA: hypothetical protein PLW09_02420 [Candidatus Kapabacteria bacterium]|nr:hypothetical protein [Candidatus Kapabacteria bacterium]
MIKTDDPIVQCPLVRHSEFELFSDWGIRHGELDNGIIIEY